MGFKENLQEDVGINDGAEFKEKPFVELTKSGQTRTLPPANELLSICNNSGVRIIHPMITADKHLRRQCQ